MCVVYIHLVQSIVCCNIFICKIVMMCTLRFYAEHTYNIISYTYVMQYTYNTSQRSVIKDISYYLYICYQEMDQ